jgi:diaminohydroxyphosphoribosylaminopyrimidine deaminase/5-amino-6-(5-phosphoribosylamino)uracil reductase
MDHEAWMQRALDLAVQGRGGVNPNPLVGAVLIQDGQVISEGFHGRYGGPHAEASALAAAGESARGADLYVNLEPCIDQPGKKTPPCVDQIIKDGVKRVFVAMRDPDPRVSGQGIAKLRDAGIEVHEGLLEVPARRLNEISVKFKTTGLPFVLLKMAMSADGKIATRTGQSKYISSPDSLGLVHELRDRYAAVLVGIGTVLFDDPQLNTRLGDREGHDPVRVIVDSRGRLPLDAKLVHLQSAAKTILATTDAITPEKELALSRRGVAIWKLPTLGAQPAAPLQLDLNVLLQRLGQSGIDSVLVEGGATVAASFLEAGLVDKIVLVIAPLIIGGRGAPGPVGGAGVSVLSEAIRLRDISVCRLGSDVIYEAYVERGPFPPSLTESERGGGRPG